MRMPSIQSNPTIEWLVLFHDSDSSIWTPFWFRLAPTKEPIETLNIHFLLVGPQSKSSSLSSSSSFQQMDLLESWMAMECDSGRRTLRLLVAWKVDATILVVDVLVVVLVVVFAAWIASWHPTF